MTLTSNNSPTSLVVRRFYVFVRRKGTTRIHRGSPYISSSCAAVCTRLRGNTHPLHHSRGVSFHRRFPSRVYLRAVGLRATSSSLQFMKRISRTRYLAIEGRTDSEKPGETTIGVAEIFATSQSCFTRRSLADNYLPRPRGNI